MKKLLLFISILTFTYSFATIKTTVANGDWFDANNWNPTGVPINEDTVVINHIITVNDDVDYGANWMIVENTGEIIADSTFALHGNYKGFGNLTAQNFASGDGDSTIIYGEILGDHFEAGNPITINFGTVFSDTLSIASEFENRGLLDVELLSASGATFLNRTNAAINVLSLATFSSTTSTNESNATIVTGDFITSENFTNNGDVSCVNWTHGSGTVDGSTGRFCISQCFVNNSTINGTVDICDASPNGVCDVDMGTIAGTVTNCSNGACGNNVGINEEQISLMIYPNPASDELYIEGYSNNAELKIFSITGQIVKNELLQNEHTPIDISSLNRGTYLLQVMDGLRTETRKLIVK